MYTNGSEEFNRLIETPNNKAIQKRLVFEDTGMVIDKFKTLIMYSSSNSQELQIGTTNMSYLNVEAFTDIALFDGQRLRLECGVELSDGSMEYAPMGVFTAVNTEKGLNSVKFTANDNMQKTEKLYTSSLTYPTTSDKIISEICEICEIELATPIENPITVAEKLQGYTCREVLGFIAGIHGKFACFDRLGQLNLRWYSEMPIEKQNSLIWSFTKSQEPFIVDKIEIAKNTETKFTSGEGNNIIYHSNPLATQQITDDILDDLRGFSYSTSNIEMLDDIRLDIWDVIKVTYLDGNEYFIPCMSIKQNMGASSTYIESFSKSKTQNQYRYEGPTAQFINRMATELLITNRVVASKVDADYVQSHAITTDNLEAIKADIKYAVIGELDADFITAEELAAESAVIKVAVVQELSAEFGDIKQLKSDVAKIDTLIFGTASGDVIQTTFANSVIAQLGDAQIKSAMIQDVSASKITAGTIYTDDVTIQSKNGQMMLKDNTIQISDGTRARVQIGKDASNDYSINVWDKSGNLMFSQGGITDKAIKSAIIRNDMVSENANIHAGKLDINSLFTEINGSSNTIKATKIYLDEENQTLEASFKSMTTTITDINGQIIVDNLIPYPYTNSFPITNRGITFNNYDGQGGIIANGTGDGTGQPYFVCKSLTFVLKANQAYTFASNCTDERGFAIAYFKTTDGSNTAAKITYTDIRNGVKTTVTSSYCSEFKGGIVYDGVTFIPTQDIRIQFDVRFDTNVGTVTDAIFHPMLVEGNVVRPWQPYALSRNGLKETITSQGTQLEVLNGKISTKIWQQDITTAIDNVNIGGTNLLVRTKTVDTYLNTTDGTLKNPDATYSPTMTGDITSDWIDVSLYDNVTITLYDTFTDTTHHGRYCLYDSSKNVLSTTNYNPRSPGSVTIDTSKASYMRITAISCLTYRYKIEKGNKATDWTPAPEDVDNKIDGINIGGTNLLPDTNVNTLDAVSGSVTRYWSDSSISSDIMTCEFIELTDSPVKGLKYGVRQSCLTTATNGRNITWRPTEEIELEDGVDYTLSVYARITSGENARLRFRFYNAGHQTTFVNITNTEWKRISVTIKVNKSKWENDYCAIGCGGLMCDNVATVELCGFKLEKGNKATDWTPAPGDVDASITVLSTKYSTLEQNIDSFKTTVSATYSTKTELQTTKSTLEQNIDSFKTTVSATYTTKEDFNALSIGGRNIIRGSYVTALGSTSAWENGHIKIGSGGDGVGSVISVSDSPVKSLDYAMKIANNTSGNREFTQDGVPCELGKQYTFSVWVKGNGTLLFRLWNATTNKQDVKIHQELVAYDKWTKVIKTFTTGSAEGVRAIKFGITGTCESMMFIAPKLERGNKATDWTAAPEDIDSNITEINTKYSSLEQNIEGFKTTVSSTYTTKTEFNSLSIGGTNILPDSNISSLTAVAAPGNRYFSDNGSTNTIEFITVTDAPISEIKAGIKMTTVTDGAGRNLSWRNIQLQDGETYTISFYARSSDADNMEFRFRYSVNGGSYVSKHVVVQLDNTWRKISCTLTIDKSKSLADATTDLYTVGAAGVTSKYIGTVEMCGFKMEIGNKATAWSYALEDVNKSVEIVSTVATQTANKFNWLVKSGTSATNFTLTDRMAKLTADIISLNGNVKVDGTMIVDGAITAGKIATNAITSEKIVAGAITADKINVSNLFAQDIVASGSITSPILKSSDYAYSSGDYSRAGMLVDLKNKLIRTPKVAIKADGSIVGTNCILSGKITATSGSITGSLAFGSSGNITHTNGDHVVTLRSVREDKTLGVFYITDNSGDTATYPFRVNGDGSFTATKATVQGILTAGSGSTIGGKNGWEITSNQIRSKNLGLTSANTNEPRLTISTGNSVEDTFILAPDCFLLGSWQDANKTKRLGARFIGNVEIHGACEIFGATTATNMTITGGSLNLGSGAFMVDANGNLTAGNANLTGGKIGDLTIQNGTLTGIGSGTKMALYPNGMSYNVTSSTTDTFFLVVYNAGGTRPVGGLTNSGWKTIV